MMLGMKGSRLARLLGWRLTLALMLVTALGVGCARQGGEAGAPQAPAAATNTAPAGEATGATGGASSGGSGAADGTGGTGVTPADGDAAAQPGGDRYQVMAGESSAAYRATEKFANRDLPNDAVGVSTAVEGELVLQDGGQLVAAKVRVDLRELKSDSSRRDGRLRTQWLESDKYPWAEFTLAQPVTAALAAGQPAQVELTGDLVVREISRRVVFTGTVSQEGEGLRIQAQTQINMSDFGIEPPDIAGLLKVDDPLVLEVNLLARPAR